MSGGHAALAVQLPSLLHPKSKPAMLIPANFSGPALDGALDVGALEVVVPVAVVAVPVVVVAVAVAAPGEGMRDMHPRSPGATHLAGIALLRVSRAPYPRRRRTVVVIDDCKRDERASAAASPLHAPTQPYPLMHVVAPLHC